MITHYVLADIYAVLSFANKSSTERMWTFEHILDFESLSDGCSGGLSKLYAIFNKKISCHWCCVLHDFLYMVGGTCKTRKEADKIFLKCMNDLNKRSTSINKVFKYMRSRCIYIIVRLFGSNYYNLIKNIDKNKAI